MSGGHDPSESYSFCPSCGAAAIAGASSCATCSTSLAKSIPIGRAEDLAESTDGDTRSSTHDEAEATPPVPLQKRMGSYRAAAAIVVGVLLISFGVWLTHSGSTPSTASTATTQPSLAATGSSPSDQFLAKLNGSDSGTYPDFQTQPNQTLLATGTGVCTDFGNGMSVATEESQLLSVGSLSTAEVGYLMGAAVAYLCPQYTAQMQAIINGGG